MPGTTPISGWRIPLDADPVADDALAIRNLADDIEAAWTAYVPAWSSLSGAAPVIGNGSLVGRYKLIGKTVHFRIALTIGTTTTMGGGQSRFTLPAATRAGERHRFLGEAFDSSAGVLEAYAVNTGGSANVDAYVAGTAAGGYNRALTSAIPFGWAVGDQLIFEGTYEAA